MNYTAGDFTSGEMKLWKHRIRLAEKLGNEYLKYKREYFYFDKIAEVNRIPDRMKKGPGKRYIYVIENTKIAKI